MESAACGSSATARSETPTRVRSKNSHMGDHQGAGTRRRHEIERN